MNHEGGHNVTRAERLQKILEESGEPCLKTGTRKRRVESPNFSLNPVHTFIITHAKGVEN